MFTLYEKWRDFIKLLNIIYKILWEIIIDNMNIKYNGHLPITI